MNKDLIAIFEYLEREKGIKREIVIKAIEESLLIAAKKSVHIGLGNPTVHVDSKTGEIDVLVQKRIVEKVENHDEEISLEDARILAPECELNQRLEISVTPQDFGRIAAQTARQVITQKLKYAEKDVIYEEYRHRVHEIISGTVKRFLRGRTMIVDLGKVEAILPDRYYPKIERFNIGERVQALLYEVRDTDSGGAEVILSRSHPEFVAELFKQEVPELEDETVIIEKIVREPGYRTKIVVDSHDPKVDPIGTCVGVRGTRIKNVIREINNEKIDVIPYSKDPIQLLINAVSPIEIKRMKNLEDHMLVIVSDEDYPSIIGKKGMNARLLAKLIGIEIKIQKLTEYQKLVSIQMAELGESDNPELDNKINKIEGLSSLIFEELINSGYDTLRKILQAKPLDLMSKVPGINYLDLADKIFDKIKG